jgi:hypothetical protein
MDIAHPENANVLRYLSRGKPTAAAHAPWDSVEDAYYGCGCHPEIVERVWDQIGAALPSDCRCLVHGTPALVHPKARVILAIGIGTKYGLRLPGTLATEATKMGAKTYTVWSLGLGDMDIRRDLGEDWVFGAWLADELSWCRRVYESFDHAA